MSLVCFDKPSFQMYTLVLISIIIFFIYYFYSLKKKLNKFQLNCQLDDDSLKYEINQLKNDLYNSIATAKNSNQDNKQSTHQNIQNKFLDKIYNPLSGVSSSYPGGSFTSPGYDAYTNYQMLGYLNGSSGQYPVFGRYKFSNSSDKYELYTINEGRNKIKIPFKTKNDYLYDQDSIIIPALGTFIFNEYKDTDSNRYNPNVL